MLLELTTIEQFNELITKGRVLVDFFATWCGPCKMLAPELVEFAERDPNITIVKVDVDKFNSLAAQYNVRAVPTLVYINDGKIVKTTSGYMDVNSLINLFK